MHWHWINQRGTILSGGESINFCAFIRVRHLVLGVDNSSLQISQIALLSLLTISPCIIG